MQSERTPDQQTVYDEIRAERARQVHIGYTADHDDQHSEMEWSCILAWYVGRFGIEAFQALNDGEQRATLVNITAVAVAAIESLDRKAAATEQPAAPGESDG